jgi:hypothetical protein
MANPSKRKGDRCEREIVNLLRAAGIEAERVPLSGAVGGSYRNDVVIAGRLRAECKARKGGAGFKVLEKWLGTADLLILPPGRGGPAGAAQMGRVSGGALRGAPDPKGADE